MIKLLKVFNSEDMSHAYVYTDDNNLIELLYTWEIKPIVITLDDIKENDIVNLCLLKDGSERIRGIKRNGVIDYE